MFITLRDILTNLIVFGGVNQLFRDIYLYYNISILKIH